MIGSFLTRGLVMILGYAYPAYECYKCVEQNKPDIQHLLFWCKYWILVAVLTIGERIGDTFISWIPMYSEAKLAFIVYLWFPKTKGTAYVYSSFFRPYLAKHGKEIDRNLLELKTRVEDIAVVSFQKAATYSQSRIYDTFQYIAAQSMPTTQPVPRQQGGRLRRPTSVPSQPPANLNPQTDEPVSPSSSSSSEDSEEEYVVLPQVLKTTATAQKEKTVAPNSSAAGTSNQQVASSANEDMQTDTTTSSEPKESDPQPSSILQDTLRVTHARMRRNPSAVN